MGAVASRQRRAGTRRAAVGAALALVLGLGLAPVLGVVTASSASAALGDSGSTSGVSARATSGNGAHRAHIGWLSWGTSGTVVANSTTVTNWHEVGPAQRAEVGCRLTNVGSSGLRVSTPGAYVGDGLDELYGGLPLGLQVVNDGGDVTFDVACSAELVRYDGSGWEAANVRDRRPMPLGGLVLADAESTGGAEYVQATATTASTTSPWRVIDGHNGGCTTRENRIEADVSRSGSSWAAQLMNTGTECNSGIGTPSAVLLADGVNALKVRIKGSGYSAVGLGYLLGVDYGDAPASFGAAGGPVMPSWSGGQLPAGATFVAGNSRDCVLLIFCNNTPVSRAFAVPGAPSVSLGATAVANDTVPYSAAASADTPDEDAFAGLSVPAPALYLPTSAPFTATVKCRGTSTSGVAGWIDWDGDKSFSANERSEVASCTDASQTGGNVVLSWTLPAAVVAGPSFLRLRVSTDRADLDSPTGTSLLGEVEDWAITLKVARLEVTKTADVTEVPNAGGRVNYTVTLTNVGDLPFTTAQQAYLVDDVSAVNDDAVIGNPTATPAPTAPAVAAPVRTGSRITWKGPLAPGSSVTVRYQATVKTAPNDRIMTNLARASLTEIAPTTPVTCDRGSADLAAKRCARVQLWAFGVEVVKRAFAAGTSTPIASGAVVAPGTPVEWRYTVTNTGSAPLTNVRLSDAWAESRTTATGTTTSSGAPIITCPGLPAGTTVVIPRLEPGAPASVTCTAQKAVVPHL
ncbi:CshA/CshB family fibrillar adhesin-related protein [Cellulomonas dongxiuzhuiae]|uniref:CshA/CshB family fibrillar adhesin-related protein n=1 Tax=Cellulomonas dongxiuzhuiae TaxID=2819979 RepID=UPI001AAECEA9|nr:CshA/CshB family fibrillar adhesin-related protein [Cellulomonas dongxiuzhuiae]MBO3088480.1 hypothetical protein [Cellulomonas dongxiuzhuiae]